jgi:hypothetical protein
MRVGRVRELEEPERANYRLKKLVAEQAPDIRAFK